METLQQLIEKDAERKFQNDYHDKIHEWFLSLSIAEINDSGIFKCGNVHTKLNQAIQYGWGNIRDIIKAKFLPKYIEQETKLFYQNVKDSIKVVQVDFED